jgi:hypothetical protein
VAYLFLVRRKTTRMLTIYRLRADKDFIAQVQKATTTTEKFGIEPTHGLFGSAEWWQHVRDGTLPVHTLRGAITRIYMGSMNDWPGFTMRTETGEESSWSRYATDPAFASLYTVGRPIELDYVVQQHRPHSFDSGAEDKIPIEIRVGENA